MPTALVTGASRGLGRATAVALAARDWDLVLDARDAGALRATAHDLPGRGRVIGVAGDVTDAAHRAELADAVREQGRLDVLVNNASALGPSPLPRLADLDVDDLRLVLETNVVAPLALAQLVLPALRDADGAVVDVTSDAAAEPYPTWGGYGSSKAALDQLTAILAAEEPGLHVYAFDPGDMRTAMHQAAFPGEDISDRPDPDQVVPALLRLIARRPPSGRYRAAELLAPAGTAAS